MISLWREQRVLLFLAMQQHQPHLYLAEIQPLLTSWIMMVCRFCCMIMKSKEIDLADFCPCHCILWHTAIQVQFLLNTSTITEGNFNASLTIQLLLTPADATLLLNITITLSVSSGSDTGTAVHEQLEITPTQVYCTLKFYNRRMLWSCIEDVFHVTDMKCRWGKIYSHMNTKLAAITSFLWFLESIQCNALTP